MPTIKIGHLANGDHTIDVFQAHDGGMLWFHTPGGLYATSAIPQAQDEPATAEQRSAAGQEMAEQWLADLVNDGRTAEVELGVQYVSE